MLISLIGAALLLATVILLCGSVRMSETLGGLERRVRSMMQVADTVAMHPLREGEARADGRTPVAARRRRERSATSRSSPPTTARAMEVKINLASGEIEPESYRQLRHQLRCLRTSAETPPDPRLIELLYRISQRTHQKIILVSGFRAPMYSMAKLSYHTRGMAADIRIPGMTPLMVRDLAFAMGVKGDRLLPGFGVRARRRARQPAVLDRLRRRTAWTASAPSTTRRTARPRAASSRPSRRRRAGARRRQRRPTTTIQRGRFTQPAFSARSAAEDARDPALRLSPRRIAAYSPAARQASPCPASACENRSAASGRLPARRARNPST